MKKSIKWIVISLIIIVVLIVFAGMYKFNYLANQKGYDVDGNKIKNEEKITEKNIKPEAELELEAKFTYQGNLIDVSGGLASGIAQANFSEGIYDLLAEFKDLPEPQGTDFYEGWVVRKSPFAFISTGKAIKEDGIYSNSFSTEKNYLEYDFYVLTIEPDDGDPAPDKHILEGTMEEIN
jgi:hypothetical protein